MVDIFSQPIFFSSKHWVIFDWFDDAFEMNEDLFSYEMALHSIWCLWQQYRVYLRITADMLPLEI
jgi:hypothetical protein